MTSELSELNAIPGWCAFKATYDRYIDTRARNGDVVVEIGAGFGRSVAYLARRAIQKGLQIDIYCVDPWIDCGAWMPPSMADLGRSLGGPYCGFIASLYQYAREELEYIKPLRLKSLQAPSIFPDKSLAMVMVDGDHGYAACAADIRAWLPKMRPDGIFAGDDYGPVENGFLDVIRACKDVIGEENYDVDGTTWIAKPEWLAKAKIASVLSEPLVVATQETSSATAGFQTRGATPPPAENDLAGWRFVETVGGQKWLGKVTEMDRDTVTMCPALECSPSTMFVPAPVPGAGYGMNTLSLSECWPPMHLAADHEITVRWASHSKDLSTLPLLVQEQVRGLIIKGRHASPAQTLA